MKGKKSKFISPGYLLFVVNNCIQRITYKRIFIVSVGLCLLLVCFKLINTLLFYVALIGIFLAGIIFCIFVLGLCLYIKVNCLARFEKKINDNSDNYINILTEMGVSENIISSLVFDAIHNELVLTEFDQNNRIISYIGDIPYYSGLSISSSDFIKRSRNKIELVIMFERIALKKQYSSIKMFLSELISLHILQDIKNVPDLIFVKPYRLTSYQSFIIGKNIGSELTLHGVSVSEQYQLDVDYQGPGKWNLNNLPTSTKFVSNYLFKEMNHVFVYKLGVLLDQIHDCGIIINDLKYGNLIKYKKVPYVIDFDRSSYFYDKNEKYLRSRNAEQDKFNYLFSINTPIEYDSIEN